MNPTAPSPAAPAAPSAPAAISGVSIQILATLAGGKVAAKLDDALRDAVRASAEAGAKAKITLELTIVPNGVGVGDTPLTRVDAKIVKKLPEVQEKPSVYFVDDEGNLSRRNPRQEELRLEALPGGALSRADLKATGLTKADMRAAGHADKIGTGQAKASQG